MSLSVLCDIAESIKNADFHNTMVDETEVSNKEQTVFGIRLVYEHLFSYDDFLGLHEMKKTNALSIESFIKDIILQLGFDTENMRDQCYDGCTAMKKPKLGEIWKNKRVATQIKNYIQCLALSANCHTHSLNSACG